MAKVNRTVLHDSVLTSTTFTDGGTVRTVNDRFILDNMEYYWNGTVPHTVPANSTPDSSGGVGSNAWVLVGYIDTEVRPDVQAVRDGVLGSVYPSGLNTKVKVGDTIPAGTSVLSTEYGYLYPVSKSFSGTARVFQSITITEYNSFNVVTDSGTFEMVTEQVLFLRGIVQVGLMQVSAYVEGWLPAAPTPAQVQASHNKCAEYCRSTGATLCSASGKVYTTGGTVNFRSVRSVDYQAQLNGNADFITLLLGGESTNTQQFYTQRVFKVNRGGASSGIRIIGSIKNNIHIGECSIIEVYADTHSSTQGKDEWSAYNKIYINSVTHLKIDSNPNTDGSVIQWVNENQFYLSFCHNFTMYDRGYKHNGNQFYGGNFEATNSTIDFQTGIANTFWNVRGERTLIIKFGVGASNNTVLTDWVESPNNPVAGRTITDLGSANTVKNVLDLYNSANLVCGFNGSTLKTGASTNILGVNPAVTTNASANTITVAANQLLYTSPLIELNAGNQYFHCVTGYKLSGGIIIKCEAFDENMQAISSTGSDVDYPSGSNNPAGFGQDNTTVQNSLGNRRIYIRNHKAKWVRFTVRGSTRGCTFRTFELSCIGSNKFSYLQVQKSCMVPA